jgi:hypothetical protein
MKPQAVQIAVVAVLVSIAPLHAASTYTQLTPATVDEPSRSFTITVDRFQDDKKGVYLRFNVAVKTKPGETPLSPFLATELEVFDGDAVVSSSLLQGTERGGGLLYSFLVAEKYVAKSKFTFGEILRAPNGEPLPSANNYWFYLQDFAPAAERPRKQ